MSLNVRVFGRNGVRHSAHSRLLSGHESRKSNEKKRQYESIKAKVASIIVRQSILHVDLGVMPVAVLIKYDCSDGNTDLPSMVQPNPPRGNI
jgi:hypothetical protein